MSGLPVSATGVSRFYGAERAVDDVSVSLARGECLALFGPNGAGKTTLLRMLGGLLRPSTGSVAVGGIDVRSSASARACIGFISHATMLYDVLTAVENVEFAARLYGVRDPRRAAEAALARLGASGYARIAVRSLSRGMQQRVAVARAVVHGPSVLLADEPFTGLDAAGAATLSGMLREQRDAGTAMVIVTHNLEEALSLCTRAAIMRRGRLVRIDDAPIVDTGAYTSLYRELAVDAA